MYNNILIEYLFLVNIIESEIICNNKLFYNLKGISNEILKNELIYCENEIKNFIQFYSNFNLNLEYNTDLNLYFKNYDLNKNLFLNKTNFLFNN